MNKLAKFGIFLLIASSLLLIWQNMHLLPVKLAFLHWRIETPVALFITAMVIAGVVIGLLLNSGRRMLFK